MRADVVMCVNINVPAPRPYTEEDLWLMEQQAQRESRESFWAYRRYLNPRMIMGWWQREVALELHRFWLDYRAGRRPKLLLQSPPQLGKLVEDTTPVLTVAGWRTHGALSIGDLVFHPSGLPTRVIGVSKKAVADHRVEFSNGEVFYVHGRHEWTVYNRNKKRWETIETRQMLDWQSRDRRSGNRSSFHTGTLGQRGSRYTYSLPLVSPLLGIEKDLLVNPYVLGVWLGDGTTTHAHITYVVEDAGIIDAIEACGYRRSSTWGNSCYPRLRTTSISELRRQLRALGVLIRETGIRTKHIPEVYLTASLRQRLDLLAGLIDTDGCIHGKNGRVIFSTSDKHLADTFCDLIATFGWRASVWIAPPSLSSSGIQGRKDCYNIGFQPTIAIPCRLPRKQIHVAAVRRRIAIKSITLEPNCKKIGNCITVDAPDGLYLIGRTLQPTHNSTQVVDFLSWIIGLSGPDPQLKIIFASFSERLGIRANLRLQRILADPKHAKIFGHQAVNPSVRRSNSEMIEFHGTGLERGSFRNTTIAGAVTGEGLDLGVIDDPIKGRAEASSKLTRDKTWNWMTDDFMTRFADGAALLLVMTRWHLDDPAGRLIERHKDVRVCRYAALAEEEETHTAIDEVGRPIGPFVRKVGEPLFPELKSAEFLEQQRAMMTLAGWQSVYQQAPIVVGGDMFPIHMASIISEAPPSASVVAAVRYWDKSGTAGGGAYTAGVLMLRMRDNTFVVADVRRGQWSALDRERIIKQTAEMDRRKYFLTKVWVEQEPGSGGKESAESTVRNLAGFRVEADRVRGAKEMRAEPFAAQWQGGNVRLVVGVWVKNYLEEAEHFPVGKYKDQIDASSGAFNKLASRYRYDSSLSWVS
jgi:predicted phage terminase large subunit-like protein